ncbi:MAG: hypothetical protein ACYSU0_15110 [Planctomycetota bacterium]
MKVLEQDGSVTIKYDRNGLLGAILFVAAVPLAAMSVIAFLEALGLFLSGDRYGILLLLGLCPAFVALFTVYTGVYCARRLIVYRFDAQKQEATITNRGVRRQTVRAYRYSELSGIVIEITHDDLRHGKLADVWLEFKDNENEAVALVENLRPDSGEGRSLLAALRNTGLEVTLR